MTGVILITVILTTGISIIKILIVKVWNPGAPDRKAGSKTVENRGILTETYLRFPTVNRLSFLRGQARATVNHYQIRLDRTV